MLFRADLKSLAAPLSVAVQSSAGASGSASGGASGGISSAISRSTYSLDQIAHQLTDGYWTDGGETRRAFDVAPGGTLSYDISALGATEQFLAVSAMRAWSDVTGIKFADTGSVAMINSTEGSDAAASTASTKTLAVNQHIRGTLAYEGDEDWYRVSLSAGQTYTFSLTSDAATGGLGDPYLELRSSTGALISDDDDGGNSLDSLLTFTANSSGTYFVSAGSSEFAVVPGVGSYDLRLTKPSVPADITFNNADPEGGAFSTSVLSAGGSVILSSYVNVDSDWDNDPVSINSYWFQTYVHEIGHALGLGHAGNYNGGAVWGVNNAYSNDSWQATVMSYFSQTDNPNIDADYAYLATVMPADIIAIQDLYGTNVHTRTGDTVYGAHSNVTGYLGTLFKMFFNEIADQSRVHINNPIALTIFDTGGTDTIDLSPVSFVQLINLSQAAVSNIGGLTGNLVIARGTIIENAIGGSASDTIYGNSAANNLSGRNGNDRLLGGAGNDLANGGTGNDTMDGGAGIDSLSFSGTTNIKIHLGIATAQATGLGSDTAINFENAFASGGNDRLIGSSTNNLLGGGAGNDSLYGGDGNDTLRNDAGNDLLAAGAGTDTIVFRGTTAVRINLGLTGVQATGYGSDALSGFEHVKTAAGADRITGSIGNNTMRAGAGNDTVNGAAGNDTVMGEAGLDNLTGGSGNDVLVGGSGADIFRFDGGCDRITDFANDVDTISLSKSLWDGTTKTVEQMLSYAQVVGASVVLDFGGGNTLKINGLTNISALTDDLLAY